MTGGTVAVVVTHDRPALLGRVLDAIATQTSPPARTVVVDNASAAATAAVLDPRTGIDVLRLPVNLGGAGGFATGLDRAVTLGARSVWLLDDDAVPEPCALEALEAARDGYGGQAPAVVASAVRWTDGRPHPMNTPRPRPFAGRACRRAAAAVGCVPVRTASFVSILVDAAAVRTHGLPVADYFLWNDDFEFTARLLRHGTGLLCPASVVVHHTARAGSTDDDPGGRFRFEVRNKVWTLRASDALAPWERALYLGATVRRWTRTFTRSTDRATLRRCLARGLAEGLTCRPRDTATVLALSPASPRPSARPAPPRTG